jgi:hypothetical protein
LLWILLQRALILLQRALILLQRALNTAPEGFDISSLEL